jgi:hypothetical protein
MHRPNSYPRRRPALAGRPAVIIAIIVVLACAGVVVAFRYLSKGPDGGVPAAAAVSVGRSASPDPANSLGTSGQAKSAKSAAPSPHPTASPAPTHGVSTAPPPAHSGSCTKPRFVTSQPLGGWTDGAYYLYNDMWNASNYSVSQTMYACSYSNWYVVANMNNNSGDGAVKTYPDVHMDFNEPKISSFHSISSTFAETGPGTGIYQDAYDIWLNGVASPGCTELMIWTDNVHRYPAGSLQATVTFGGRTYQVWKSGSWIAFVADTNFSAGSMNLLQFFDWVIGRGWIPASSTLGAIDYGAEIVSTNSVPATFTFTNFSVGTS